MNSIIGMFQIESAGFGRGLGVLDLNPTNLSKRYHMLDFRKIESKDRNVILEAFKPLLKRPVFGLEKELTDKQRINFDGTVLKVFGAKKIHNEIYKSLLSLFHIRQTARTG